MPVPGAALAAPCAPLQLPTMTPFDYAASLLSGGTRAEGSLKLRRQRLVHGAASSSPPPPPRGTRASWGGGGGIRCQDYWRRAKAGCAHRRCRRCCSSRGFVCPAHDHEKLPLVPAFQCNDERQQMPAPASTTAVRKRPRELPSDVATTPTTSSSVDQPVATVPAGRFAREVSLDAVFRRVRLGPGAAEVAYHTTVTIAGHVFRGVLYDVGPRGRGRSRSRSTAASDTGGSCERDDGSSLSTAGGSCLDLTLRL